MHMVTYRVSHREQGTATAVWTLKMSGAVADQFQRKNDAVKMAKQLAREDDESSKVVVEKKNGTTQNTFTYNADAQANSDGFGLF